MEELIIKGHDFEVLHEFLSHFVDSYNEFNSDSNIENYFQLKTDATSVALKISNLLGFDFDCDGYLHEI